MILPQFNLLIVGSVLQQSRPDVPAVDVDSSGAVLQPADAVRFDCGPFSHWALYVGE